MAIVLAPWLAYLARIPKEKVPIRPTGYKTMAIPTTLLVDEQGVVRWIDQADAYRLCGDERRVSQALAEAFRA